MKINNSYDALKVFAPHVERPEQEQLLLACLTHRNELKHVHLIGLGTDTSVYISAKIIARQALLDLAGGVILCHNHPSGDPQPSACDTKQTEAVRKALSLFDISLLDHIIMGKDSFYSFADETTHNIIETDNGTEHKSL